MAPGIHTFWVLFAALVAISAAQYGGGTGSTATGGGGSTGNSWYSPPDYGPRQCPNKFSAALAINFAYTGGFIKPQTYNPICSLLLESFGRVNDQQAVTECKPSGAATGSSPPALNYKTTTVFLRVTMKNPNYGTDARIPVSFNKEIFTKKGQEYGVQIHPTTIEFRDIDECKLNIHKCSPNAYCYNIYGSYECKCKDGFTDISVEKNCPGTVCEKPKAPVLKLEVWVYVLIGVAIVVLLMLIFCCCCFYTGSDTCNMAKTKVIKRIQIVQTPVPVASPCQQACPCHKSAACTCSKAPEEKKVIIQVENAPPALPALPAPPAAPTNGFNSHSAFIANLGGYESYDGKVCLSSGATRALPWASNCNLVPTVTPLDYSPDMQGSQVQYVTEAQPSYIVQEPAYQAAYPPASTAYVVQ